MFSRWFQKGRKGDKSNPTSDPNDPSPLVNQNQIQQHIQQQQHHQQHHQSSKPANPRSKPQPASKPPTNPKSSKDSKTQLSSQQLSSSIPSSAQSPSDSTSAISLPQATITKDELNSMPEGLRNRVAQLSQWHHDISLLQTRLATYSNVLLDLSRAGIEVSSSGKTLQENSNLFGDHNLHHSGNSGQLPLPEIQAFEVFHYSIDLATRQALNPIITASNDQIKSLTSQQLQQQHETSYLKAAQQVTTFHQQFDPNHQQNMIQYHKQQPHPSNINHNLNLIDDSVSVAGGMSSYSVAPTRLSVAPTRRTYKESKIRQPVPPSLLSQYRQQSSQQQQQQQHGSMVHPHHVQSYDPNSLILQPPRAQLPTSTDAKRLHHHLESWKDGMLIWNFPHQFIFCFVFLFFFSAPFSFRAFF